MQFAKESIDLILAGTKTQTRRSVKAGDCVECHPARAATIKHDLRSLQMVHGGPLNHETVAMSVPGTVISPTRCRPPDERDIQYARVRFLNEDCFNLALDADEGVSIPWRATRHWKYRIGKDYAVCPGRGVKQVARILLTSIRCERVGDISDEDAVAEGVYESVLGGCFFSIRGEQFQDLTPRETFLAAWKHLYPKSTPDDLVWALGFEVSHD
jgi:NAD-dependent dihydropyrimidine dehydrogenase PreA subunit